MFYIVLLRTVAFSAIQDAYNDSTASAQRVNASEGTVDESADIREEIENDKKVQPANSRELDRLNQNMASGPDLTPVAREVTSCAVLMDVMFLLDETASSFSNVVFLRCAAAFCLNPVPPCGATPTSCVHQRAPHRVNRGKSVWVLCRWPKRLTRTLTMSKIGWTNSPRRSLTLQRR